MVATIVVVSTFGVSAAFAGPARTRTTLGTATHPLRHLPVSAAAAPLAAPRRAGLPSGTPDGYLPCDVGNAYRLTGSGLTGSGVVIAVVDAFTQPAIRSDLTAFDRATSLPDPPSLNIFQPGGAPAFDQGWADEITLDVEWAHAIAPGATIDLIEEPTSNLSLPGSGINDLTAGISFATQVLNADVVSMSWSTDESSPLVAGNEGRLEGFFPSTNAAGRPVTYLASSGDAGHQTSWPAIALGVIGVGGTSLAPSAYGYTSDPGAHFGCAPAITPGVTPSNETVWGGCDPSRNPVCEGTGGGPSAFESKPSWQSIAPGSTRDSGDVAMVADPLTGVATVENGAWSRFRSGGTSLSSPLWAGVVALLDEERQLRGTGGLNVSSTASWVYSAASGDFNDITTGSSPSSLGDSCVSAPGPASCSATIGYDLVTGRGSPSWPNLLADVAGTGPGASRGNLVAMAPTRIMDTRSGLGGLNGPMQPGQTFSLQVGGHNGIPSDAAALVVNVGVTNTSVPSSGYVLLYPCGQPRPLASTLNFFTGQTVAILTQAQLGSGCLNVYMNQGQADVFLDAEGYFTASPSGQSGLFDPLSTPSRALDTRTGIGAPAGALGQGQSLELQVAGNPNIGSKPVIPAGASSIVLNLTAVNGTAGLSFLSVYPAAGGSAPCPPNHSSSNLNFTSGQIIANRVTVRVGAGGNVCIFNNAGSVDVVADISGWYSGGGSGDTTGLLYSPWPPTRAYDSRLAAPLGPDQAQPGCLVLPVPPATSGAVSFNLTALDATIPGYLEVYPAGQPPNPPTSDLNTVPGSIVPNLVIARLGDAHSITVCNAFGGADFIVDLSGGYS